MSVEELEKLGIIFDGSILNKYRYWCNTTQSYLDIPEGYTGEQIMDMIYNNGKEYGIEIGKRERSSEIKALLNNETC